MRCGSCQGAKMTRAAVRRRASVAAAVPIRRGATELSRMMIGTAQLLEVMWV